MFAPYFSLWVANVEGPICGSYRDLSPDSLGGSSQRTLDFVTRRRERVTALDWTEEAFQTSIVVFTGRQRTKSDAVLWLQLSTSQSNDWESLHSHRLFHNVFIHLLVCLKKKKKRKSFMGLTVLKIVLFSVAALSLTGASPTAQSWKKEWKKRSKLKLILLSAVFKAAANNKREEVSQVPEKRFGFQCQE